MEAIEVQKVDGENKIQLNKTVTAVVVETYIYDDIYDKLKAKEQEKADFIIKIDEEIAELNSILNQADVLQITPFNPGKTLSK